MAEPSPKRRARGLWWDKGETWVEGCTPCSAGCRDCWARALERRSGRVPKPGPIRLRWDRLDEPLHWRKPRVVAVWNDWCHEDVPLEFQCRVLDAVRDCPQHTFILLTKRAKGQRCVLAALYGHTHGSGNLPYANLIAGVTCESSEYLWRVEELVRTPAAVRFVNAHLLGPLDLVFRGERGLPYKRQIALAQAFIDRPPIDWLAVECNRPFRGEPKEWWGWCESLVQQTVAADVPVWVKQGPLPSGKVTHRLEDFPEWARRREFPSPQKEGVQ